MKIRFAGSKSHPSIATKGALSALLLFVALALPAAADTQGEKDALRPGFITDIRVAPESDKVTVTVATDRMITPQELMVDNPARLVLDFPRTVNRVPFMSRLIRAASVTRVRVQQFQSMPDPITRVVFDLEEGHGRHETKTSDGSVQLVFYKPGSTHQAPPASTPVAKPAAPPASTPVVKPAAPPVRTPVAQPAAPPAAPKAAAPETAPVKAPPPPAVVASTVPMAPGTTVPLEKTAVPAKAQLPAPQAPPPAPLVAALASQEPPTPLKMTSPTGSRFSGTPLTLDLIDIPLVDFFRLMADEGGINIVMDPEIKGRVSIKVVKVPWDQIFEAVLTNHGLDKQVEGTVVRIARKSTLQEEARQQEALKKANLLAADLETRVRRLNYAKANTLIKALEDQKTVRGTIVVEERTNALILTDLPSSLDKLMALIDKLDIPQPQVEIEARIVSAARDFARDIGIQFGFVQGNLQRVTVGGPNTFGTIGGTRPSATPKSTFAAGNLATGRGASEEDTTESGAVSTGSAGNYNVNLPATKRFGGVGISIGNIFDTFLLDAAITAGESKGLAKLISQPKVTAQNNSPAVITQGLRFPVPVVANNTVTVQFHNAALTLTVTPQITYEGNIVLDLKVENNTPDFGQAVDGIPSIRTSESTTRVLVSDGGTTVIGGILTDDEASTQDRVPGLGSLPIVGNLFRRNALSRRTQEVLFFVTPRIVK